jgi:hypothetical protein
VNWKVPVGSWKYCNTDGISIALTVEMVLLLGWFAEEGRRNQCEIRLFSEKQLGNYEPMAHLLGEHPAKLGLTKTDSGNVK